MRAISAIAITAMLVFGAVILYKKAFGGDGKKMM